MHAYAITYRVVATSRLEAIEKASALLRTGVRLRGVTKAEPSIDAGPFWVVTLSVEEDA